MPLIFLFIYEIWIKFTNRKFRCSTKRYKLMRRRFLQLLICLPVMLALPACVRVDGNRAELYRQIKRDTINWPVIADAALFDTPALQQFGLTAINDNVVYHNGRVVAQHLKQSELIDKIKELP